MRRIYGLVILTAAVLLLMLAVGTTVGAGLKPQQASATGNSVLASAGMPFLGDYQRKLPPPPGSVKPAPPSNGSKIPNTCDRPVVNASQRVNNEDETFLVVNPITPTNYVAFSNLATENSIFRAYTMNGGTTWTRGTVVTGGACCDGQAVFDTFGNLFMVYINGSVNQINVILSTDGGATFGSPINVGNGSVDQPSIAVGNGSVWVDWNQSGSMVARGAQVTGLGTVGAFGAQQSVPGLSSCSFGGIAVGPGPNGGKVMLTCQNPTGGQGPATIFANVDVDGLGAGGFAASAINVTSTNVGGFDFIPAQNGRSIDAEAGLVWDSTGGPFNDRVYLVYTEETVNENNDTDILVRTSTNNGTTWSAPVRVNDDPSSPIRSQFLPYITLDRTSGFVAVGFYDARNDSGVPGSGGTNSIPNDDGEYFASFSTDGGATWAPNQRLSSGFSNADDANAPVDYGDYLGQDAYGGKFVALWADNANCDGTNPDGTLHAFDLYLNTMTLPAQGTPTPTVTGTPPTATRTPTSTQTPTVTRTPTNTPTIDPCLLQNYQITSSTGATVVPATTFVAGSNCDDCSNSVALPFSFSLYGQPFSSVNAVSNGNLQFNSADTTFTNTCLPYTAANYAILPHWDDLLLTGTNQGIYTLVEGTAPNRVFDIEWRGGYFSGGGTVDIEVRLFENSSTFEVIYGTVTQGGSSATVGVQRANGSGNTFTQFECNTAGTLSAGQKLTFTLPSCGTPTPGGNTPTRTNTPTTGVNTPTRTNTPTGTTPPGVTNTPTNTPPPVISETPTEGPSPTACPIQFTDVPVGSTFYTFIRCLACRGIINGYPDGTFRPNNNVTRGQLSKIVSNSAGFGEPHTEQSFQDIPTTQTFYIYIQRLASRGIINGYPCGGPGEPCVPPDNLPYFRPNNNATRGQISKIVSEAAGFIDPVSGQTFEDVPPGSTFYEFIERLASRGVMSGYPCGQLPTEPCVPPDNRPYFRPNNNATRGQTSKIVANTFFPGCETPTRPNSVVSSR